MLLNARQQAATLTKQSVVRLVSVFNRAVRDIDALDHGTSPLTLTRARTLKAEIKALLQGIERSSATIASDTTSLTVERLVQLHQDAVAQLEALTGVEGIAATFATTSVRAVAHLAARAETPTIFRTLVKRHITEAQPELNAMIESAVARGVSPARLTNDVARLIGGHEVAADAYGMKPPDLSAMRTVFSDARRIAVSEVNNALREANAQLLATSRTIEAAKWQLSGAHPRLDACDVLAESDWYGLGAGMYVVGAWPTAPHPYCGCYQGGPIVFRPVSEWKQPRGPIRPLLDEPDIFRPEGLSPKAMSTAVNSVRENVQAAHAQPIR